MRSLELGLIEFVMRYLTHDWLSSSCKAEKDLSVSSHGAGITGAEMARMRLASPLIWRIWGSATLFSMPAIVLMTSMTRADRANRPSVEKVSRCTFALATSLSPHAGSNMVSGVRVLGSCWTGHRVSALRPPKSETAHQNLCAPAACSA